MDKLNDKLLADLLLTKAMSDSTTKMDRWNCLNDVINEVFADGALDRNEYLISVMELTQLGLISSNINEEEDIEMSEAVGFDIVGVTEQGLAYIERLYADATVKGKVTAFFDKFNEVCNKLNENGAVKLLGTTIVPIMSLLTQL